MDDEDEQAPPPREGKVDAPAGNAPEDIPMTGEEDPLAEVSDGDFSEVVAEFAQSEQEGKHKRDASR